MDHATVLVLSDSHGDLTALAAVLRWAAHNPLGDTGGRKTLSAAVFLGDGGEDIEAAETGRLSSWGESFTAPWYRVRGNGDFDPAIPNSLVLETAGRTLFLTHGNRYGLESGRRNLAAAAKASGAEAALFGHTHIPFCGEEQGLFLLNPGSIGRPRSRIGPSFAVLDCPSSGPLSARFFGFAIRGQALAVKEITV